MIQPRTWQDIAAEAAQQVVLRSWSNSPSSWNTP